MAQLCDFSAACAPENVRVVDTNSVCAVVISPLIRMSGVLYASKPQAFLRRLMVVSTWSGSRSTVYFVRLKTRKIKRGIAAVSLAQSERSQTEQVLLPPFSRLERKRCASRRRENTCVAIIVRR